MELYKSFYFCAHIAAYMERFLRFTLPSEICDYFDMVGIESIFQIVRIYLYEPYATPPIVSKLLAQALP